MTDTTRATHHGIPLVVVPMTFSSNHQIAHRVDELGIGVVVPGHSLDVTCIRQSISRVLGRAEYLSNVRRMQARFNAHGGAKEAADQIEKFVLARRM